MVALLISVLVFASYLTYVLCKYGIQKSISDSYYRLTQADKWAFTIATWGYSLPLIIAGNGPEEANLKKLTKSLGITKNVHFMGKLKFSDTLELASKSGVGAALYNGRWGFNEFGDSTKVREYANFGLPVLSTDKHATVLDIEKFNAGVIVDVDTNSYVAGLQEIFNNYDKYSANSRKMGEAYAGVHSKLFKKLLRQK